MKSAIRQDESVLARSCGLALLLLLRPLHFDGSHATGGRAGLATCSRAGAGIDAPGSRWCWTSGLFANAAHVVCHDGYRRQLESDALTMGLASLSGVGGNPHPLGPHTRHASENRAARKSNEGDSPRPAEMSDVHVREATRGDPAPPSPSRNHVEAWSQAFERRMTVDAHGSRCRARESTAPESRSIISSPVINSSRGSEEKF